MDAVNALRLLSHTSELPEALRVRWAAGCKRLDCADVPNARMYLGERNSSLRWQAQIPYEPELHARAASDPKQPARPLCFVHLQGPQAKDQYTQSILESAGIPRQLT